MCTSARVLNDRRRKCECLESFDVSSKRTACTKVLLHGKTNHETMSLIVLFADTSKRGGAACVGSERGGVLV